MKKDISLFIDFDSTFVKVESLDLLSEISLYEHPQKEQILQKIQKLTFLAMNGEISFSKALEQRTKLLNAYFFHIEQLIEKLKTLISESIKKNKNFFTQYTKQIYIISGGFKEFILPVVSEYGIQNIFANTFIFSKDKKIIGVEQKNLLSQDQGKAKLLDSLSLTEKIYVIGDGFTDYEMKSVGSADKFFAFTENIKRKKVIENADYEIQSFDEFLQIVSN